MTKDFKITLNELDTPVKILFTGYLTTVAIGYFFALIQILFTHGMADGKFGLSIDDIVYSYYGNRSGTVLESKLNGSMKNKATEQENFTLMQWARDGALEKAYTHLKPEKIIENKCQMCHNESASGIPDFTKFENLKELAKEEEGATFSSLTRVSHIHLFGISFIFMFVGLIFSFSTTASSYYKSIAIGMPYAFLIIDILSWWLTKLSPLFASLIMVAGMGMGASFAFMWVVSMKEMWFINNPWICNPDSRCQRTLKYFTGFGLKILAFIGRTIRLQFLPSLITLVTDAADRLKNIIK